MKKEIVMPPVVRTTRKEKIVGNLKTDIHRLQNERDTYKNQKDALMIMFKNLYADFKNAKIQTTEPNKFFISKLMALNSACENLQKNPMMKF